MSKQTALTISEWFHTIKQQWYLSTLLMMKEWNESTKRQRLLIIWANSSTGILQDVYKKCQNTDNYSE